MTSPDSPGVADRFSPALLLTLSLLFLGLIYVSLFNNYRAYEIDNPWYLSFSHNYWIDHASGDPFLNGRFPDGMGGTAVFGALAATVQGAVLSHAGWLPISSMLLSSAVVLAGLAFWFTFLRAEGLGSQTCSAIIVAIGLTEPFVGMAERSRYEPFCFLMLGAAFWLTTKRLPEVALVAALLALEIEPAAVLVFLCLAVYMFRSGRVTRVRLLGGIAIAAACFAAVYLMLHPRIVDTLRQTDWSRGGRQRQIGGFLRAYFITRKRHLPELFLLLVAAAVYLRGRAAASPIIHRMAESTGLVCLFSFVMNWPTPAYMVFFFPFALVVAGWALAQRWTKAWLLPIIVCVLMLPQYAALMVINRHEGFRPQDFRAVAEAIARGEQAARLNDAQTRIMGDYSLWFAHPERYRALAATTLSLAPTEQLFLCFDGPLRPPEMVDPIVRYCGDLPRSLMLREAASVQIRGHLLHVLVPLQPQTTAAPPSLDRVSGVPLERAASLPMRSHRAWRPARQSVPSRHSIAARLLSQTAESRS